MFDVCVAGRSLGGHARKIREWLSILSLCTVGAYSRSRAFVAVNNLCALVNVGQHLLFVAALDDGDYFSLVLTQSVGGC